MLRSLRSACTVCGMTQPELMTTTAAARALGVTTQTIRRWVNSGQLTAVRSHTGRYRIDAASVELLRPQPVTPEEQP